MRTVGVEEELLLVDPETGEPQARAAAVLARAALEGTDQDVFEKELHDEQVEFATHPQSSMTDLGAEIVRCRKDAARHAEGLGSAVVALAAGTLGVPTQFVPSRASRSRGSETCTLSRNAAGLKSPSWETTAT